MRNESLALHCFGNAPNAVRAVHWANKLQGSSGGSSSSSGAVVLSLLHRSSPSNASAGVFVFVRLCEQQQSFRTNTYTGSLGGTLLCERVDVRKSLCCCRCCCWLRSAPCSGSTENRDPSAPEQPYRVALFRRQPRKPPRPLGETSAHKHLAGRQSPAWLAGWLAV